MDNQIRKTPISWHIWIALWVLPMFIMFGVYQNNPITAISVWIMTGTLILLMLFKTKWVLPWFCIILMFDLVGYGAMIAEDNADIVQIFAVIIKELSFLGYIIFSKNAKVHQGKYQTSEPISET